MYQESRIGVVIAAAGSGKRMAGADAKCAAGGSDALPKQFLKLGGVPLLRRTVAVFENNAYVDDICVTVNEAYRAEYEKTLAGFRKVRCLSTGGRERQDSVGEGLRMLAQTSDFAYVMIHDAARPYVTDRIIEDSLAEAVKSGACVAAVPVKDTIRQGVLTLERSNLYSVQTPQTFRRDIILQAYARAVSDGYTGTDDGSLVERLGLPVTIVRGDYANLKITTKEDLPMEYRMGTGFDVHRLESGRRLVLGGVEIAHEKGLAGHSDADVLVHAVMDALLGAAAAGDIGRHFPDSDSAYKDISSIELLRRVGGILAEMGYCVSNIDATLIGERPKIAPHAGTMRRNIASALDIEPSRVSVKATTTEKLGFTGREEGIAAQAAAVLQTKTF